jgi:hypothetical protein
MGVGSFDYGHWDRIADDQSHSQVFRNGDGKPVFGIDIDGTLGDYHGHFLQFAEGYFGRPFPSPDEINPGRRLSEFMEIDHRDYRDCKLAYRQGGLKRTMPAYLGAADLTRLLRSVGAEVWICTTRPYLRLDNIDPDTREWLRRNDIEYDAVIFDDPYEDEITGKYAELIRQVGLDRIVAVVDDLAPQLQDAKSFGIKNLYLRAQPYNGKGVNTDGLTRIGSLGVIEAKMLQNLHDWRHAPKDA